MADVALIAGGSQDAPLDYTIPGAQEIVVKAVTASFDGSGAGSHYVPTLQIIAPNGRVLATCPVGDPVAAGASADVSWFPNGGVGEGAAGAGIQFDVDNVGDWLNILANSVDPGHPLYGIVLQAAAGILLAATTGLTLQGIDVDVLFSHLNLQGGSDVNISGQEFNLGGTPASPNPFAYLFLNGGQLSFFGVAPVVQQATPATLGDVVALLQAYGLAA